MILTVKCQLFSFYSGGGWWCSLWSVNWIFCMKLDVQSVCYVSGELSLLVWGSLPYCSCNSGNGHLDIQGCDTVSLGEWCPVFGMFKVSSSSGSRILTGCLILADVGTVILKHLVPLTQQHSITSQMAWIVRTLLRVCRSRWPCSLRRRSAAARLLRLWVRIPPGAWMSVCCECQVEVSATSWSLVQRIPTDCGVSSCVI